MTDLRSEEQNKIKNSIDTSYRDHVNGLILSRFRLIIPIGITLHLGFVIVDRIAYPTLAATFLKIRWIDVFASLPFFFISFSKNIKPYAVGLGDAVCSIVILGMSAMVFISDGSSNRYYEGANIVFLAMGFVNPFYIRRLEYCFLIWIMIYEAAMIFGNGIFNLFNFTFANYYMVCTAILVVITTKLYKDQHYNAYVRQEQLKMNEKTLAGLYSRADKLSKTDTLTEVNNRRHFSDLLNKKIQACEASKTSFYLVIFDVDRFKEINDSHGHSLGDKVLVKVVEIVRNNIRSNDFIGRFGGDEFVIGLDIPGKEGLIDRLMKIRDSIKALGLVHNDKKIPVSISIGAVKFIPGTDMNEEKLIEKADLELFNVKKNTRGEISVNG